MKKALYIILVIMNAGVWLDYLSHHHAEKPVMVTEGALNEQEMTDCEKMKGYSLAMYNYYCDQ